VTKHRRDPDPRQRALRRRVLMVAAIVALALAAWAMALMWEAPIAPVAPLSRASFAPEQLYPPSV